MFDISEKIIDSQAQMIPAIHPKLPTYQDISWYLRDIDSNRWYCNFGPLVKQFEQSLAALFKLSLESVVTMSSGTMALTAVLKAYFGNEQGTCLIPSYTFSGTAAAVQMTQLTPMLCDVELDTWSLDIKKAGELCKQNKDIKCIIVVSPFGAPLPYNAWEDFAKEYNVKVVIDAAGAFDSLSTLQTNRYTLPTVVSLHATKSFGIGEGGLVLTNDTEFANQLREISNFGFSKDKQSTKIGLNAKMSEYHAAVGLAVLENWRATRLQFLSVVQSYLGKLVYLPVTTISSTDWFSSTFNVRLPKPHAKACIEYLSRHKVDARLWWRDGLHTQPAFSTLPKTTLDNTESLASSVVGLPFYCDLSVSDITRIVGLLFRFLR